MTYNPGTNIKYFFSKYSKVIILIVLLVFISIPIIEMMYLLGIKESFDYLSGKIISITGVNQYFAKAIVMALMIPLLWSFKWTFSISSQRRKTGYTIVACYTFLFFISMFFLTREQKFDFSTGQAMKYYAATPEGIRYFDAPGFDPKYGIPLKAVDATVAKKEALQNRPPQKLDEPRQFFDFVTREPLVWYYQGADGTFEFFDQPGFHPKYAQELKAITPEIVEKYEKQAALKKEEEEKRHKKEMDEQKLEAQQKLKEEERGKQEEAKLIIQKQEKEKRRQTVRVKNTSSFAVQVTSGDFSGSTLAPGGVSFPKDIALGAYKFDVTWVDRRGNIRKKSFARMITESTQYMEIKDAE